MLHEHENQVHAARLEIIVIWLIGECYTSSAKTHAQPRHRIIVFFKY